MSVTPCYAALSSLCIHGEASPVYLDGIPDKVWACGPCVAYALRVGLNPKADRRAVQRIPEWRKRDLSKILDHGRVA